MVQKPTCTGLRIRSIADCNIIFHAVALGILRMVSRRLSVEERRAIQSGCVFVWEERTPVIEAVGVMQDGLERWTDSRRWGASRLTKDFLLYQEKLPDVGDPGLLSAMFRSRLVKQTYSVYVETPEGRRKWHLVAYCSPETGDQLATVDDIPTLTTLRGKIPEGTYQPARCTKGRTRPDCEPEEFVPGGTLIEFAAQDVKPSPSPPSTASTTTAPTLSTTTAAVTPNPAPQSKTVPSSTSTPSEPPHRPPRNLLPKVTTDLRRDPHWVLDNYVAVSPDIGSVQAPSRGSLSAGAKSMPPLLYMRYSPYRPRHPLDNDALRAFDTIP